MFMRQVLQKRMDIQCLIKENNTSLLTSIVLKNQIISNLSIFLLNLRFQSKVLFSLQEVQKVTFFVYFIEKNNDIVFNWLNWLNCIINNY